MVVETEIPRFLLWLSDGLLGWLIAVAIVIAAAGAVMTFVSIMRHGLKPAPGRVWRLLLSIGADVVRISPRRVWALGWLAVKESLRRRVVVVFIVFFVITSFAGWFLDPGSDYPARLYLSFVLTTTSYLVLPLALFLSAFSLPADIRNRTLHTIVTKPVRPSEVVLGRIVGFVAVASALLVFMGLISYVFVTRGLAHTHELTTDDVDQAVSQTGGKAGDPVRVLTSRVHNHQHEIIVDPASGDEILETAIQQGHKHAVTITATEDETSYEFGPPQDMLVARVPVYGKLRFLDRRGYPAEKGINVGDEWGYRSYIEGQTGARAIWTFEGISEDTFPGGGLPLEMTLAVFRSHKGKIDQGIGGSLVFENPDSEVRSEQIPFTAKEFKTDKRFIPRTLKKAASEGEDAVAGGTEIDLFDDLVTEDGRVEIHLQCVDRQQCFGVAQADLYLRARDASFAANFAKGYFGIWLQVVLVIVFGVTFSTFLSEPVAMIATTGMVIGGLFREFMIKLAANEIPGGGPIEALIRLVTQQNVVSEMEPGLRTDVAKMIDGALLKCLDVLIRIVPDFGQFGYADYVAYGFDISANMLAIRMLTALGYFLPVFLAGCLFLKVREVAR